MQKTVTGRRPRAEGAPDQAATVVNARVDALTKDAKARRARVEARVAELQAEAQAFGAPTASRP